MRLRPSSSPRRARASGALAGPRARRAASSRRVAPARAENPSTAPEAAAVPAVLAPPSPDLPGLPTTSIELAQVPVDSPAFERAAEQYGSDRRHPSHGPGRSAPTSTTPSRCSTAGSPTLEATRASAEARIDGLTSRLDDGRGGHPGAGGRGLRHRRRGRAAQRGHRLGDPGHQRGRPPGRARRPCPWTCSSPSGPPTGPGSTRPTQRADGRRRRPGGRRATALEELGADRPRRGGRRGGDRRRRGHRAGGLRGGSSPRPGGGRGVPARGPRRLLPGRRGRSPATDPGCRVRWWGLAGISRVEGRHGTYGGTTLEPNGDTSRRIIGIQLNGTNATAVVGDSDGGALDGDAAFDRAVGPDAVHPADVAPLPGRRQRGRRPTRRSTCTTRPSPPRSTCARRAAGSTPTPGSAPPTSRTTTPCPTWTRCSATRASTSTPLEVPEPAGLTPAALRVERFAAFLRDRPDRRVREPPGGC